MNHLDNLSLSNGVQAGPLKVETVPMQEYLAVANGVNNFKAAI